MAKGFNARPSASGGNMMSQLAKLQEQIAQVQDEIAKETVTETSGGGAVAVTMTGNQECVAIKVDPELLTDVDAEMLSDMLLAAVNKALESSRKLSEEKMAPFTNMLSGFGMGR